MSTLSSYFPPRSTSGAMYSGVPSWLIVAVVERNLDSPKSASFAAACSTKVLHARGDRRDVAEQRRLRERRGVLVHQRAEVAVRAQLEDDAQVMRIEDRRQQHYHRGVAQLRDDVQLLQVVVNLLKFDVAMCVRQRVELLHGDFDAAPASASHAKAAAAAQPSNVWLEQVMPLSSE